MPLTPAPAPEVRWAWEAEVEIGERQALGPSPLGERYIIPILGGQFAGPRMRGKVLPGGADRQLWRPDGVKELDALYELQVDDGAVITIRNRVLIDESVLPERYARSVVQVTAPAGPHAWLNRRVFVGTLHSLRPARTAVCIRVYEVN